MCAMLEEAMSRLGIPIRRERMPEEAAIGGGLCLVHGKLTVIISPSISVTEKIELFARALRKLDTESIWLPPAVRELLEKSDIR